MNGKSLLEPIIPMNARSVEANQSTALQMIEENLDTIETVLCSGMGFRAISSLNSAGIKVYRGGYSQILDDEISEIKKNTIQEMKTEQACTEHRC